MEAEQIRSPEQISDSLRITSIPTYLLAGAVIVLLGAFIVWGFLGNVSDVGHRHKDRVKRLDEVRLRQ
jgi:hypothetical protein